MAPRATWDRKRARSSSSGDPTRRSWALLWASCWASRCTRRRCTGSRVAFSYAGGSDAPPLLYVTTTLPADHDSMRAKADAAASELRLALFTDTYPPQLNGVSRTLERL